MISKYTGRELPNTGDTIFLSVERYPLAETKAKEVFEWLNEHMIGTGLDDNYMVNAQYAWPTREEAKAHLLLQIDNMIAFLETQIEIQQDRLAKTQAKLKEFEAL